MRFILVQQEVIMGDENEAGNSDEGADPSGDIQKQNPSGTTTADQIDKEDPNKVEKLTKLGHSDHEAAEE